ncbi:MAG: patatin-like phospholipase family protein [Anaerolineae bacterium]|jgi:NTE family protein|nr:patatin-like phospholipase family protein [Anaerolineae bacterium]MDH7474399.1 patatin-like phospholipase family protein [Anaerolineae bacterium]
MKEQQLEPKRALILSGGGGRGAYHCGVYEYLETIGWRPDILVGTSIGAINAAAIASGRTATQLKELWLKLDTGRVQRLRTDILDFDRWTYLLDTSPWRRSLLEDGWFDFDYINSDRSPTLAIVATDVWTGDITVFCNRPLEKSRSGGPHSKKVRCEPISLNHIMASCSIPILYPWTSTGSEEATYWDGAVVSNTPLGTALRAGATEIVVVLLSPWEEKGAISPESRTSFKLWTLPGLALDWVLLASFRADLKLCEALNMFAAAYELLDREQRQKLAERLLGTATAEEQNALLERLESYNFVQPPTIIAPRQLLPVEQIVTYDPTVHRQLFKQGFADAVRDMRHMVTSE